VGGGALNFDADELPPPAPRTLTTTGQKGDSYRQRDMGGEGLSVSEEEAVVGWGGRVEVAGDEPVYLSASWAAVGCELMYMYICTYVFGVCVYMGVYVPRGVCVYGCI